MPIKLIMNCKHNYFLFFFSDKMFPVLGFGAKLAGGEISHEFAVVSLIK